MTDGPPPRLVAVLLRENRKQNHGMDRSRLLSLRSLCVATIIPNGRFMASCYHVLPRLCTWFDVCVFLYAHMVYRMCVCVWVIWLLSHGIPFHYCHHHHHHHHNHYHFCYYLFFSGIILVYIILLVVCPPCPWVYSPFSSIFPTLRIAGTPFCDARHYCDPISPFNSHAFLSCLV